MFKVNVEIDTAKLLAKSASAEKRAQEQLDQDVIKDSNYYIPKDKSTLEGSALIASQIGKGKVIWDTPYARRLYYNPGYNFSTDKNPNARGLWFEAAKAKKRSEWLQNAQANYKREFSGR